MRSIPFQGSNIPQGREKIEWETLVGLVSIGSLKTRCDSSGCNAAGCADEVLLARCKIAVGLKLGEAPLWISGRSDDKPNEDDALEVETGATSVESVFSIGPKATGDS